MPILLGLNDIFSDKTMDKKMQALKKIKNCDVDATVVVSA